MPRGAISRSRVAVTISKLILVVVAGLLGGLIGHWGGAIFLSLLAIGYAWMATISSGRYPLDLHNGAVIDGDRAPETVKFVAELSAFLGIYPPDLYYLDLAQPQVCVCASGYGPRMRARIGMTKALLREADAGKLRVLLSIAVARIWSGHASAISSVVAFSGLGYQYAQSDAVNSFPSAKSRDPETELNQFGGMLISLWSAIARPSLSQAGPRRLVHEADSAALNLGQYSYKPEYMDSALRWLASKQFPQAQNPIATYNPAETFLYLVSPFEGEFSRTIESTSPKPWRNQVERVVTLMPSLDERINFLRSVKPGQMYVPMEAIAESEVAI